MNRTFNILLVDDDIAVINALRKILAGVGKIRFATNGPDALRLAKEFQPDLMLLDIEMPDMSGLEVCAVMKDDQALKDIPIIFVTSSNSTEQEVEGLTLGAVDFIGKPPSAPLVSARVRTHLRLKQLSDELRKAAVTDVLTGIANRRCFDDVLARELSRADRCGTSLALVLIDVDCFKAFNDCYGHVAGDHCLTSIARAIQGVPQRACDLVARYGGEEIVVVLPETAADGACAIATRILGAIESLAIPHTASVVADHVTLSIGVSVYSRSESVQDRRLNHTSNESSAAALIAAADQALYSAKEHGRRQARFLDIKDLGLPQNVTVIAAYDVDLDHDPDSKARLRHA